MGRHKQINGKFVPAGLAVRHDILKMIYREPSVSIRLPSALQLAKKHSVSRATVTNELKKLSDSGWIIGKPGIGSFSNPEKTLFNSSSFGKKIIGLLAGDTWSLFGDYTDWVLFSGIGLELMPDAGHPKMVTFSSLEPKFVYQELSASVFDGLVWLFPLPEYHDLIRKLQKEGKKIITLYTPVRGVPCIQFDHEKTGKDIAELLIRKKIRTLFWCTLEDSNSKKTLRGAEDLLKRKKIRTTVIEERSTCMETLEALFRKGEIPDALFVHSDFVFPIRELLGKYALSEKTLLITSYGHVRKDKTFRGIVYRHDFEKMARLTAEYMKKMLNGHKDQIPLLTVLNTEIILQGE